MNYIRPLNISKNTQYGVLESKGLKSRDWTSTVPTDCVLSTKDFIAPVFLIPGQQQKISIPSLEEQYFLSIDLALQYIKELTEIGIKNIIIYEISEKYEQNLIKTFIKKSLLPKAIYQIKTNFPDLVIHSDLGLCQHFKHGHCGIILANELDNDLSLALLRDFTKLHALAGSDVLVTSSMTDGAVKIIRNTLTECNKDQVLISSQTAKLASAFYGPFRSAVASDAISDKLSYQVYPGNLKQALQEMHQDLEEAVDILMLKPSLTCLDLIATAKENFTCPVAAFSPSGEYHMIKAGAAQGLYNEQAAILDHLLRIKSAGADLIVTYFAKVAAEFLQ